MYRSVRRHCPITCQSLYPAHRLLRDVHTATLPPIVWSEQP